jgi:ABC-type transport system involved in multi-copper enzyme maturation permease subunit
MTTLYAPTAAPVTPATLPPPLARLARIELRKAVDTRAGRWLLVLIALVAVAGAVITAVTGEAGERNLLHVLGDTSQLVSVLLPVLGILLVTSEWSQRTALTTFTLVPRRSRIIAAKVGAGALLAAGATAVCVAVSAVALLAADYGRAGMWPDAGRAIGYAFVFQILNLLLGVGFGLLFRSTPVAIVVYFVVPTAWSILTSAISALTATGRWLDPSVAWNHLAGGTVTAATWAQIATTAAVWVVLPVLAGGWRVLYRPVGA